MWHFIQGYVIIQIEGLYPERLLNGLRSKGVPLWGIERTGPHTLKLSMPAAAFRLLAPLNRRCKCRIRILSKRGLRYAFRALLKRRLLLFGTLLLLLLPFFFCKRVLFISVTGCEKMDEAVLLERLDSMGVGFMKKAGEQVLSDVGSYAAAQYDEIAFLGLHVNGVFLRVDVVESVEDQGREDLSFPCEVVAVKDGIVTGVTVFRGRGLVKMGDLVEDGQVLISGEVTARDDSMTYLTHAYGVVTAAVVYHTEVRAPEVSSVLTESGVTAAYCKVEAAGRTLFETKAPFAEASLTEEPALQLSSLLLPVSLIRGTYRELIRQEQALTKEEQKAEALFLAERDALLQVPRDAAIIMINLYAVEKDGAVYGICTITTEENIGLQREITG